MDPDPASMNVAVILISVILLLLSALFHLCDEAFFALGENRLGELAEDGNRKARRIRKYIDKERQFTARIRLSTLFFGGLAATLLTVKFDTYICAWLYNITAGHVHPWIIYTFVCVVITLVTVFLFGFAGCILPRRLVFLNPEAVSLKMVGLFSFFYVLLYPIYGLCALVSAPLLRLAGIDLNEDPDPVTEDDIRQLMDEGEEIGAIEGVQKDMVNNIFEFDDTTAAEIMTPRIDVIAVDVEDSLPEALTLAVEHGYSRLPVYEEDIDHIIGILYIKDLLPYVGRTLPKSVTIRSLLRDTLFVPDTKKCDELFENMNEKHLQMCIVVDEYGGVAGIVTVEDLLESIVGNMQDEFDNEEEEVTQLDEDSFEVDGSLNIDELSELLDVELPEGDYDTVAGFILDQLGHIPEEDEETVLEYENLTFTVQQMDDRRIEQLLVRRHPTGEDENTPDTE
ncbi:MAG: HlyC/CorC family transporter [Clostridia bacterium]|nr:HlyC/CorC family transporter [Clostridia bacterium]